MQQGVDSFYRHLPLKNMRCDLDPTRVAVWWSTQYVRRSIIADFRHADLILYTQCLKLSAYAAQVLSDAKQLDIKELEEHSTFISFIMLLRRYSNTHISLFRDERLQHEESHN